MRTDNSGKYVEENIDNLIMEFVCFRDLLHSIERRDPEIRDAIMNASYKDYLTLKQMVEVTCKDLNRLKLHNSIDADAWEQCIAAGEHPYTVD